MGIIALPPYAKDIQFNYLMWDELAFNYRKNYNNFIINQMVTKSHY